ncbi:MAG TPA: hypothetical protein ENH99_00550 [Candidatus Pacearchaeota archaeon]|nr:hypothetical protein [Candidatus Pacearchaeota archaeon]
MAEPEISCCNESIELRARGGDSWRTYRPLEANCNSCGNHFQKQGETGTVYVLPKKGEEYQCLNCEKPLSRIMQLHPYLDENGIISPEGVNEEIPYCPKCDEGREPEKFGIVIIRSSKNQ